MDDKIIRLHLESGTVHGPIIADLGNWNGKAVKIPFSEIDSFGTVEMDKYGAYMLFHPEETGEDSVYIGESQNVLRRLKEHRADGSADTDGYWNTAIVFLGTELNKAHVQYLEARLIEDAAACGRNKVLNKNKPSVGLSLFDERTMEEFIENVKLIMFALGYKTLMPLPQPDEKTQVFLCRGNGAKARGFFSMGGFTVEEGSRISDHVAKGFGDYEKGRSDLRNRLVQDGIVKDGVFVRSYEFSSPSAAAAVVEGYAPCGYMDWKTEDGKTLKELMQSQAN